MRSCGQEFRGMDVASLRRCAALQGDSPARQSIRSNATATQDDAEIWIAPVFIRRNRFRTNDRQGEIAVKLTQFGIGFTAVLAIVASMPALLSVTSGVRRLNRSRGS
jgi:hypothetical protein